MQWILFTDLTFHLNYNFSMVQDFVTQSQAKIHSSWMNTNLMYRKMRNKEFIIISQSTECVQR